MTAPIQHEPPAATADACPGVGSRGRQRAGKAVVYGLLLLAGFCCLAFSAPRSWWQPPPTPAVATVADNSRQARHTQPRLLTRPIRDVRPGQRVLSENPELEGVVVEPLEIEPDHWRLVIFETVAPDGPVIESHVLCEQEFLELDRIAVGQTVDLSFSEFGFSGPSQVVRIAPCPPIEDGPGHVVTATFRVSASEIIDVYVDSLHEPIGTTPTHPFWSETRHAFVPAAELHAGEVLRSITGTIERVTAVVPRSTSEPVYNFEVEGEHVYYVSAAGILVHNQCISPNQWESIAGRALKKEGYSVLGSIKNASGHGVDLLLRNAAGDLVVAEVKSSARRWRGLSRLQKAKGAATYLGDAVNNAVGRQGLWTLQNLRGGSAALAAQIQAELKGASVTGILIQINEHAKRIRIRNW